MREVEVYEFVLKEYRTEWELTNPMPESGRIHGMDFLQFYLFMPVAMIGPFVSAFRTAALLRDNSAFQTNVAAWVETIIGTVFFELAAIVYQFIRLRRLWQRSGKKDLPEVGMGWIIVGLIATVGAVTTSNVVEVMVAALLKAGVDVPAVLPALAIGLFVGLGVPLTTVVAGETIGRFLLEWQAAVTGIRDDYEAALAEWDARFNRSWSGQKTKRIAAFKDRLQVEVARPRSEYSEWNARQERLDQIVRFVKENGPSQRDEIFKVVWNSKEGALATKYKDLADLIEADSLVEENGKLFIKPQTGF